MCEGLGWAKKLAGVGLVVLLCWELLAAAPAVTVGVRQALTVCGSVLIPSLFPFMVLAALLPATAAGQLAAAPFRLVARFFYGVPGVVAPAILMSWLGGYPAGAKVLAVLVEQKKISPQNAGKALCFCVNSGPAFLVTVVGAGVFGSPLIGLKLFACQIVAGMLAGRLLLWRGGIGPVPVFCKTGGVQKPFADTLVAAVTSAAAAMVSVCAFVLLMAAVQAVVTRLGAAEGLAALLWRLSCGYLTPDGARALVLGMLEICGGCTLAGGLAPQQALSILPFLLSFGGLSVICQVLGMVGGQGIPTGRFLVSRLLHGVFTQLLAYPLLKSSCTAASVGLMTNPALHQTPTTLPGVVLLLALCGMLCLTVEGA